MKQFPVRLGVCYIRLGKSYIHPEEFSRDLKQPYIHLGKPAIRLGEFVIHLGEFSRGLSKFCFRLGEFSSGLSEFRIRRGVKFPSFSHQSPDMNACNSAIAAA
jgi:hypothetical protein